MVSKFLSKTTGQNDAHSNLQAARRIHAGTCRGARKTTHPGFFFEYSCFTRFCYFSAVPWSESAVGIHTSPPFWTSLPPTPASHPSRASQSMELGSLCYKEGSHELSILHMVVHIYASATLPIPPPPSPHLLHDPCPHVHSLHLHLHSWPANRFPWTVFLDST